MGQSHATTAKTFRQFRVMVLFERSYPTTFTGRLKSCTISTCWPITHVFAWLSRSFCCSPSYVRTVLICMVLTTEATYHSRRIIFLFSAGLLLFNVRGTVPGFPGVDFMIATSAYTCFKSCSVAPPPFNLTFFSAGLCTLACLFLLISAIWSEESSLYSSLE